MSCVLRVFGRSLDLTALLVGSTLSPYRTWQIGTARSELQPDGPVHADSGACFAISTADFDAFPAQVDDAIAFLECHADPVRAIVSFPGVEAVTLDFGIALRDIAVHCDYLPPRLLKAAAAAGVGMELSHYP
ncbi:hypothetical protein C7S18_20815 [Ahniella affigens]|uniref:DUF4279 domain-containing protein n=1 Tax=Ahniella affigens TaxID=2021234 RepID=A0A2P1PX80_9GAMM|nr:hypothetical protein [Ahniella affigens]AVP99461.1 hypothetical protein C7S18_20815 [Ahniella affigens]